MPVPRWRPPAFEMRGRRVRDERRPWLDLAGCIAVRGTLTWQHLDFWDALRFVLVVNGVVLGAQGTSCRPCQEVCSASRAARAGTLQIGVVSGPLLSLAG